MKKNKKEALNTETDNRESKFSKLWNHFLSTKAYGYINKYLIKPILALYNRKFIFCIVSAVIVNLFIEIIGRRSFSRLAQHVIFNPHMFLYGSAVIAFSFCISLFFKRRLFAHSATLAVWIALGISNARLLKDRSTPLVLIDFEIMRASVSLSTMYLTIVEIVLLIALVIGILIGLGFIFRFCPKDNVNYKRATIQTVSVALLIATLVVIFSVFNVVDTSQRLPEDYNNCGYVYCLTYSFADVGIEKPEKYSKDDIDAIKETVNSVEETCPEEKPNIIVLQLESFMDMYRIDGIEFADGENPHPYFSSLKENYPGGMLTVNALGACTANVEYEFLTSTDIRDYGFDDYPYKSFLETQSMESVAYVLKELGYSTTAIHNNNGGFYGRYEAYANLGFDRFIPKEAMGEFTEEDYTYKGWARDEKILDQIKGTLDASEGSDFIMTVTVQCHSKYITYRSEDIDYPVEISGFEDNEKLTNMLMYYAVQVREEDQFLEALLSYLNEWAEETGEETLVIMYGDHLPTFITGSEQLVDYAENPEAKYDSEYVLWWTDGLNVLDEDEIETAQEYKIKSFELAPYALDLIGIRAGNIMRLYHADLDDDTLSNYRNALAYDILQGKNYYFDGKSPYERTDIDIGLTPITVTNYFINGESLFVEGSGFTPSTAVYINGSRYSTEYISERLLEVSEQVTLKNGDEIYTCLLTYDITVLDSSNKYVVKNITDSHITANEGKLGLHSTAKTSTIALVVLGSLTLGVYVFIRIRLKQRKKKRMPAISSSHSDYPTGTDCVSDKDESNDKDDHTKDQEKT